MHPELGHHYHDGWISGVTIGPRREITLRVILDSVWNDGVPRTVAIRFGGIENHGPVAEYCELLAQDCAEGGGEGSRIDRLHYDSDRPSNPNSHWLVLEVEGFGTTKIHCRSVTEESDR